MFLMQVLDQVMMERDLEPITESQYRKSIEQYSAFLGREAQIADLRYAEINLWLKSLKGKLDATTIVNRKKGLTVVWNHLAEIGEIEHYHSRRLFSPKIRIKPVVSWTLHDFEKLIHATQRVKGDRKSVV